MRTLLLLALLTSALAGQTPALPEKAAKYHSMLIKRPKPGAIFERFTSAWLEDRDIASMRSFLEARAKEAQATTGDRLVLGFFLSQQGEPDAAIAVFAQALEKDPSNEDAWFERARAESKMSKHEEALKSLEHVKAVTGETAMEAAKLKAQMLARVGRTDEALKVLKELATANVQDEDLQDEVIELQLDEGLNGEAMDSLKALLERTKDPYQRVMRRLRLGDILKKMDRRQDALAAYSQCLDDAAQDSWVEGEVLAQIEQTFRAKDDLTGLREFLAKMGEKHATRLALGQLRARVLLDLNEGDEAVALHREMVQKNPGNAALKEAFIDVLARLQKFDDAVTQCEQLVAQRPKDKELRIHYATLLYQARRPGEAMKELKPLIAEPKTPEFEMLRVARLYESFEDAAEARKLYLKTVEVYPESITATDALANFMHAHGDKPRAVELWKKQGAAPAIKDEVLRVARALSSRGEHAAALEVLQAREKEFAEDAAYLIQLIAAANGSQQPDLAKGWALTLLAMAKDGDALDDALRQVRPVFRDAKLAEAQIKELRAKSALSVNERCLLAELLEQTGDAKEAKKVVEGDDAMLLREQARLFLLRQDFENAAKTLEKAIATKKDVSVVEQLVSMWRSASNFEAAMKWASEWKQMLPSSVRPWLAEAVIFQSQSKSDEAVKVLKAAARKFNDDLGVKTALASALTLNNQAADAQRIYQTLYDESEELASQLRCAGLLAETAQRRGALKELLEAFQERQRGNRTSLSPWLAIAEIHRRTNNYEGRRNALLEASRLKPKDIDLLHQIAKADEDQGDWRKAIETLTNAAALDKTTKTKQRMAEVHLRYGDEETGLRLAFELNGGSNTDPRDAEGMAVGLMSRSNWKGAVSVIDPVLNQNPSDYRLRYLKLLCLIEDEKLDLAINEAVALMDARVEVLTPSVSKNLTAPAPFEEQQIDPISEMIRDVVWGGAQALTYRSTLAELTQSHRYFFSASSGQQLYFLPQQVRAVKPMVTALLVMAKADNEWSDAKVSEVIERLGAAGHPVPECVRWFEVDGQRNRQMKVSLAEVEKHLDQEKLVQFWISQYRGGTGVRAIPPQVLQQLIAQGVNLSSVLGASSSSASMGKVGDDTEVKLLHRVFEHYESKNPVVAAMAMLKLWQSDPENADAFGKVMALASTIPLKKTDGLYAYLQAFNPGRQSTKITPDQLKLRDATIDLINRYIAAHPAEEKAWRVQIPRLHLLVEDWDQFATTLEAAITATKDRKGYRPIYSSNSVPIEPVRLHHVISAIEAMPQELVSLLLPVRYGTAQELPKLADEDAKAINEAAKKLKDPELRAILAWRAGDTATFDAFVAEQLKADKPKVWALMAKSVAIEADHHAEYADLLVKARAATTDRDRLKVIDAALVYAVTALRTEGKAEEAKRFQANAEASMLALRRAVATGTYYELERIGAAMEGLGMKEEAARQRKLAAAAKQSQSRSYSSLNTSQEQPWQLAEDIRSGKQATTIPKAVRGLKQFVATLAMSTSSSSYEFGNWIQVARSKASDELWKQLAVGEPTTPRAKLERAFLADLFGKPEIAIPIYEEAVKTKPRDAFLRWQLAMALILKDAGNSRAALEHLVAATGSDLGNVAMSGLSFTENRSPEEMLSLVTLLMDYIERVKAKAKSGELDWTSRVVDMLISASGRYDSKSRLPNLLEKTPKIEEAARALNDRRLKLFERFCALVADVPSLAEHVLPAEFALAYDQKKDIGPIVKKAKLVLAGIAASQSGTRNYSFAMGRGDKSYSGSWSGERMWTPLVPVMLLHAAKTEGSLASFEKEVLPLIRGAYDPESANDIAMQLKLFTCAEGEFEKLAKEYEERQRRTGSSEVKPTAIFRIWQERKLKNDMSDLLVRYLKGAASRNYGLSSSDEVLAAYVLALSSIENREPLAPLLKKIFAGVIEKPEKEWPAFVNQNPKSGTPGYSKLAVLGDFTGRLVKVDAAAWMEVCSFLIRNGMQEHSQFDIEMSNKITGELPKKAADLVPVLLRTTLVQDVPNFFPGVRLKRGVKSYFERVIEVIQAKGTDYNTALVDALVEQQGKQRSFGAAMIIGRLSPISPDMKLTLEPCVKEFAELKTLDRRTSVLAVIKSVWPQFDKESRKPGMEMLKVFGESARLAERQKLTKWFDAKQITDVSVSSYRAVNELGELVVEQLPQDVAQATKLLTKGLQLIDESYARGVWDTSYHEGFNAQSELIKVVGEKFFEKVEKAKGPPSLVILPLLAKVCLAETNRSAMYPFVDSTAKLGRLLSLWFERRGGFADPRKATRELVEALTKVMGDAEVSSLLMPCYAMESTVPIWYRTIIRSEASELAKVDGPNKAVAQELAAGFDLNKHDEKGLVFIRERMRDTKIHPLLRQELAAVLARSSSSPPVPEDMKLCLEAITPTLLNDGPAVGQMWERVLSSFNQLPTTPEWTEQATGFRSSWMKRAQHFSPTGSTKPKTLRPSTGAALSVLELFARSASDEEMRAYARKFTGEYERFTSTRLVLARYNRVEQLKEVMAANEGVTTVTDKVPGIGFRADDDVALENMSKAISDPSLAALGRMQIAQVQDSAWQAPTTRRVQRIADETQRVLAMKDLKPSALEAMKPFIMESPLAVSVVAPVWLKSMKVAEEFQKMIAITSGDERKGALERFIPLVVAHVADGDASAWKECLKVLEERAKDHLGETSVLEDVAYRVATSCGHLLNVMDATKCGWIGGLVKDLQPLVPASSSIDQTHGLSQVWFAQGRLAGTPAAYDEWRKGLPERTTQKRLMPTSATWLPYALELAKPIKGEDGGALLAEILTHDWVQASFKNSNDISYRGKMPARLHDATLRQHTAELLKTLPNNKAVLMSVMNAWNAEADKKPLHEAVKALESKLNDKRVLEYAKSIELETMRDGK